MRNQDVADVVSDWIANRSLSRRKLAFMKLVYDQFHESPACAADVVDSLYSEALDLPPGSATIQVVASLLDHLVPLPEHRHHRLIEATEKLVEDGAWEREAAESLYEALP